MIFYENLAEVNRQFFNEYEESFKKTLKSGWYILGENVKRFETEFASYLGIRIAQVWLQGWMHCF